MGKKEIFKDERKIKTPRARISTANKIIEATKQKFSRNSKPTKIKKNCTIFPIQL